MRVDYLKKPEDWEQVCELYILLVLRTLAHCIADKNVSFAQRLLTKLGTYTPMYIGYV